jgi:glycylpeptide N-tetradecanoyltransferase
MSDEDIKDLSNNETMNGILEMLKQAGVSTEDLEQKKHAFWDTQVRPLYKLVAMYAVARACLYRVEYTSLLFDFRQPMPHGEAQRSEGPIVEDKKPEEIRSEPYNMPGGFEWSDVDVTDKEQRTELYSLLANNYVEDGDALFRFDYSENFLRWALTPPGYRNDFLLGVRATTSKKLVAFISAVPTNIRVRSKENLDVVEINYLCIHKKLRAKRLAPVLIKEITRRVNKIGVFQAVYTAGVVVPVPVGSCRYYHRSLNPKKLVRIGFSRIGPRMTLARMQKLYKVPAKTTHALVPMTVDHVNGVHSLLTTYLQSKFALFVNFTREEISHWLVPREGVINTYVVEDPNDKSKVTDMVSFYHLPSTILGTDETLYAAYSYYNVATSTDLTSLMRDALILANKTGSDVLNALNLMENKVFLEDLKFGKGDGNLQYYVYNWSCASMKSEDVGLVLL